MITKQALSAAIDAALEKYRADYEADPDITSVGLIIHIDNGKVRDTAWRKESIARRDDGRRR